MNVETIIKSKGRAVATIAPSATVARAVAVLREKRIGALVVSGDGDAVEGILSERDVVHALAEHGPSALNFPVSALMTRRVFTCRREDGISDLMALMTDRRIRHVPVVEDGRLCGIVSIGDVVKCRIDEVEYEASSLREFIIRA
jgi:CBS domain-containing protein